VSQLQLNLLDSHDTPRFHSLAGGDRSALALAMLIVVTLPGAPCIYYGDEIGLEGARIPIAVVLPWIRRGRLRPRAFVAGLIALRKSERRSGDAFGCWRPGGPRRFGRRFAAGSAASSGVAYASTPKTLRTAK